MICIFLGGKKYPTFCSPSFPFPPWVGNSCEKLIHLRPPVKHPGFGDAGGTLECCGWTAFRLQSLGRSFGFRDVFWVERFFFSLVFGPSFSPVPVVLSPFQRSIGGRWPKIIQGFSLWKKFFFCCEGHRRQYFQQQIWIFFCTIFFLNKETSGFGFLLFLTFAYLSSRWEPQKNVHPTDLGGMAGWMDGGTALGVGLWWGVEC